MNTVYRFYFYVFLCIGIFTASPVKSERIITSLSENKIIIHSNFTGAEIFLFGAIEGTSLIKNNIKNDIIIVLRGPLENFDIRRKENIAGIWINKDKQGINKAPAYYAIFSSSDLRKITSTDILRHYGIGFKADDVTINPNISQQPINAKTKKEYQEAFIRLQKNSGKYYTQPNSITKVNNTLFHVRIQLPNDVPRGQYIVDTYLFKNSKLIHSKGQKITIEKSGIQKLLFFISRQYPLLYGIISLLISLAFGILIGILFSRKKH